jgi:NAD(P)H-dependent FMN reductase
MLIRIAIILGSAHPGAHPQAVTNWLDDIAATRTDVKFKVVEIQDFMVSTPKIAAFDAYLFVTPARNGRITGALRSAVGYLYAFCNRKVRRAWGRGPTSRRGS